MIFVKNKFDEASSLIWQAKCLISEAAEFLTDDNDKFHARRIQTDLVWAVENCTVIGLHQIGEALEDTMGHQTEADTRIMRSVDCPAGYSIQDTKDKLAFDDFFGD